LQHKKERASTPACRDARKQGVIARFFSLSAENGSTVICASFHLFRF
jgi:hypothetical protein